MLYHLDIRENYFNIHFLSVLWAIGMSISKVYVFFNFNFHFEKTQLLGKHFRLKRNCHFFPDEIYVDVFRKDIVPCLFIRRCWKEDCKNNTSYNLVHISCSNKATTNEVMNIGFDSLPPEIIENIITTAVSTCITPFFYINNRFFTLAPKIASAFLKNSQELFSYCLVDGLLTSIV